MPDAVISDAVQAFHTIYRLSVMCVQEIAHRDGGDDEGDVLLLAIRDIAEKHGYALDHHPASTGVGLFDERDDDEDSESEAANG